MSIEYTGIISICGPKLNMLPSSFKHDIIWDSTSFCPDLSNYLVKLVPYESKIIFKNKKMMKNFYVTIPQKLIIQTPHGIKTFINKRAKQING